MHSVPVAAHVTGPPASDLVEWLLALSEADTDLGQHFLTDEAILTRSLELAVEALGRPLDGAHVLEVGPGPGVLTQRLLEAGARVTAIELAEPAVRHLRWTFSDQLEDGRLTLIEGDALEATWPEDLDACVSNPPYQISSPLLERLENHARDHGMGAIVLLLQEEVTQRMLPRTGGDASTLGLTLALAWQVTLDRPVPKSAFRPAPAVESRLVQLRLLESPPVTPQQARLIRQAMHAAFAERRRKVRNTLRHPPKRIGRVAEWHGHRWRTAFAALVEAETSGHPDLPDDWPDRRPEDLDLAAWIGLIEALSAQEVSPQPVYEPSGGA